jgi:glyoxylase-like metal-dependent hydrolase (beta-lactamase superfamily II)
MAKTLRSDDVVRVDEGVYLVSGSNTNWILVKEGDAVTLIDSGYPADYERLLASLSCIGVSPGAVHALLVTHAHNDHIGTAESLWAIHGIPALMHEDELPHARRDFLQQVTVGQVLRQAWRPRVLPWAVHAMASGGTFDVSLTSPRSFPAAAPLDLPGAPTPVPTPGHTKGHCAYLLPGSGILISGDALVTAHPTSHIAGPQLLPTMFDADRAQALTSLRALESLDSDIVLPGHGPMHHGNLKEAVAIARERVRQ